MRNELHIALNKHLQERIEQYGKDKEKLNEFYSLFDENALSTLKALRDFANLLYWHGINEDGELEEDQHIYPSTLISTGVLLKNSLDMLDLSLFAKDKIGDHLYLLAQGE